MGSKNLYILQGMTEVYNKGGQFMYKFNSQLCSATSDNVISRFRLENFFDE